MFKFEDYITEQDLQLINSFIDEIKEKRSEINTVGAGTAIAELMKAKCQVANTINAFGALKQYDELMKKDMGVELDFDDTDLNFERRD